jgi:hypothetical protein
MCQVIPNSQGNIDIYRKSALRWLVSEVNLMLFAMVTGFHVTTEIGLALKAHNYDSSTRRQPSSWSCRLFYSFEDSLIFKILFRPQRKQITFTL